MSISTLATNAIRTSFPTRHSRWHLPTPLTWRDRWLEKVLEYLSAEVALYMEEHANDINCTEVRSLIDEAYEAQLASTEMPVWVSPSSIHASTDDFIAQGRKELC